MSTIKAFSRYRALRDLDLLKAIVNVKAHTRNGRPVAAHERNIMTSGEKKDMVSAMAAKLAAGGSHKLDVPAHHAHAAAEAYAKQTGKAVHLFRHDDGSLHVSHEQPKGKPHLAIHPDKTTMHHADGSSEDVIHDNARVALKRAAKRDAKAAAKPKSPAAKAHAEEGATADQAQAHKELHGKILEHLDKNPRASLASLREKMGHPKVDKQNPLANPVHAAMKHLRDSGQVDEHRAQWGEPSFSKREPLGAPENDDHAAMRAHVEKQTGAPVHPSVDRVLAMATKAGKAHEAIERTYGLAGGAAGDEGQRAAAKHARDAIMGSQAFKDQDAAHDKYRKPGENGKGKDAPAGGDGGKPAMIDPRYYDMSDEQLASEAGYHEERASALAAQGRHEQAAERRRQHVEPAKAEQHRRATNGPKHDMDHVAFAKWARENDADRKREAAREEGAMKAGHQKEAAKDAADHKARQAKKATDYAKMDDATLKAHAAKHEKAMMSESKKSSASYDAAKHQGHRAEAEAARAELAKRASGESKGPPAKEATAKGFAASAKKAVPHADPSLVKYVGARMERYAQGGYSPATIAHDLKALADHYERSAGRSGGGRIDPDAERAQNDMRRAGLRWYQRTDHANMAEEARGLANHIRDLAGKHGWRV